MFLILEIYPNLMNFSVSIVSKGLEISSRLKNFKKK